MDPSYMRKLQKWVELDNKIIRNKEAIKDAVEEKKECETAILEYIEKNKQNNLVINISDGAIKFPSRTTTQPISMRFLKSILQKYSIEKTHINDEELYKYIVDNLERKTSTIMTRDFKTQA